MKVRVSIINYSNTIPFTYGLLQSKKLASLAEFSYGYPAQVAQKLCHDEVDASIISIEAIPSIPQATIFSDFCISATHKVDSVLLCSPCPLSSIETITLDYQSRTSNTLVQILAACAWQIYPTYQMGREGYELAHDGSAKVIIGDRALVNAARYPYVYDLAHEWYTAFGLPFVFACWVANKPLSDEFISVFNEACQYGISHIDDAIESTQKEFQFDIRNYLYQSVEFQLNDAKRASMDLYFEKARSLGLL